MNQVIASFERQISKFQRDDPSFDQQSTNRIYLLLKAAARLTDKVASHIVCYPRHKRKTLHCAVCTTVTTHAKSV